MNKGILILIVVIAILVVGAAFLMNPTKQESKIEVVSNSTAHIGSTFLVKLVDSKNNPIANQEISIVIVDNSSNTIINKNVKTNDKGMAGVELDNVSVGKYKVNATFKGTDKFKNSTVSHNLVVVEGSTDPVQIDTSNPTKNTNASNSTNSNAISGSGEFYSAQSDKVYYPGEVDLGPDGHHWLHLGNNEWVRID